MTGKVWVSGKKMKTEAVMEKQTIYHFSGRRGECGVQLYAESGHAPENAF
jgi:hypothetical protein